MCETSRNYNFTELLEDYDKFILFVQKSNDMDTCAAAVALARLIKELAPEKLCRIAGLKIESTKLKESKK